MQHPPLLPPHLGCAGRNGRSWVWAQPAVLVDVHLCCGRGCWVGFLWPWRTRCGSYIMWRRGYRCWRGLFSCCMWSFDLRALRRCFGAFWRGSVVCLRDVGREVFGFSVRYWKINMKIKLQLIDMKGLFFPSSPIPCAGPPLLCSRAAILRVFPTWLSLLFYVCIIASFLHRGPGKLWVLRVLDGDWRRSLGSRGLPGLSLCRSFGLNLPFGWFKDKRGHDEKDVQFAESAWDEYVFICCTPVLPEPVRLCFVDGRSVSLSSIVSGWTVELSVP